MPEGDASSRNQQGLNGDHIELFGSEWRVQYVLDAGASFSIVAFINNYHKHDRYPIIAHPYLGDPNLDDLVNEAKGCALQCINMILSMLINDRSKTETRKSPFYVGLGQLIPTLIVCLISYTTNPSFDVDKCSMHL